MRQFFLLLFLVAMLLPSLKAEKIGLIIAIGDYPTDGKWPSISSVNDIAHVKAALNNLGFDDSHISTLVDGDATFEGIKSALEKLIAEAQRGDLVYIHYSGHGQQVLDDNDDELDHLDEAIVPYDSPKDYIKGVYEGERLFRDDMIGELTRNLRKKIGTEGQVVLVLDSCHSGTGTRGMGLARGTAQLMAPDDFVANMPSGENTAGIVIPNDGTLAPMASFYGASPRELNYETLDDQKKPVGSLSYALAKVIQSMTDGYTFEDIFDKVRLKMKSIAPRQNPQWEGPKNVMIFGGKVDKRVDAFKVTEYLGNDQIEVNMGTISDIYAGSKVDIFSVDQSKVINHGEVINANLSHSIVLLDAALAVDHQDLLEVRVTEKAAAEIKAFVQNDIPAGSHWAPLASELSTVPIFEMVTTNADIYISECGDDNAIQLATKDGSILYTAHYAAHKTSKIHSDITEIIRSFVQCKLLKSYENPNSKFDFDINLNVVNCEDKSKIPMTNSRDIEVKVGSCVQFVITNKGLKGGYFSIIDIQPDHIINLVVPATDLGYTADEYYLKPGESYTTDYLIEIAVPAGEETMKLIASGSPMDLSGVISTRGKGTKGVAEQDPFEQMLTQTYNVNTKGRSVRQRAGEEVGTSTLYFKIVE